MHSVRFEKLARRRARFNSEDGFTLAELLVVISILGIVAGVLALALVVSGKSAAQTTSRLSQSHDAQIASAYLATDVQSSKQLTTATCPPSSPLTGQVNLINFSYDGTTPSASYFYGASGDETQVVRTFCVGGALQAEAPVVHFAGPQPTVTCPTTATPTAACDLNGSKPNKVKIAFVESGDDSYTFAVSGTRRQYALPGEPQAAGELPRLLALSGSTGCGGLALSTQGNGGLTVNGGDVIVNSTCQPAVQRSGNGVISIPDGGMQIVAPGTCSGCATAPSSRQIPVPDPFLGLAIPDDNNYTVFTDGNPAHGPGVYRGTPLSFPNGTTKLAAGEYIVESGFSFAGQAVVDGTEGVLFFNGCGLNAPVGCTNAGIFSVTGQVSMQLNPTATGPYKDTNLVFWQPLANQAPITIAGNGAANSLAGVVYAPGAASVNLSSGNGGLDIGYVVAPNISVSGNGSVTIG